MPRTYDNIPGRVLARGDPLDTVYGSDLLKPSGRIPAADHVATGLTSAFVGEPFTLVATLAAGAAGPASLPVPPFKFQVINVHVICSVTSGSGTVQLKSSINGASSTAVTDAIVCATDKKLVVADTIDDAQSTIDPDSATPDVLSVTKNGTADAGLLVLGCVRVE